MAEGSVGGGFKSGFGGCLGVGAALLVVGFGVVMCSSLSRVDRADSIRREEGASRVEYIPAPSLGSWTLSAGTTFRARAIDSRVTLTVSCSRRGGSVFGVWFENVPRETSDNVVATTFVIDGASRRVGMEGVGQAPSLIFMADFPDSAEGVEQENALGRALLRATSVEWRSAHAGIPPQRWTLTPELIAEAARQCG